MNTIKKAFAKAKLPPTRSPPQSGSQIARVSLIGPRRLVKFRVSEVAPRISTLYCLRGQLIGEASNPGPASRRRLTWRLRALQRSMDSDSESEDECGNVARRLEGDEQPLVQLTPHMDLVPSSPRLVGRYRVIKNNRTTTDTPRLREQPKVQVALKGCVWGTKSLFGGYKRPK